MNIRQLSILSVAASLALCSCSTRHFTDVRAILTNPNPEPQKQQQEEVENNRFVVKTTAYTHHEPDSLPYGVKTARGTMLKHQGEIRSAAADWSRYPVGTKFRIVGSSQIFEVDDYGSALVGTDTIDIYQPTLTAMRSWGAPIVGIEVLEWGSFEESAEILEARIHKATHCREMYHQIQEKMETLPEELRDGYQVTDELEEAQRRRIS